MEWILLLCDIFLVLSLTDIPVYGNTSKDEPIMMMSPPSHMSVLVGDSVLFPCNVKNIGKAVRIWKRIPGGILFSGTIPATADPKIRLVEGSSLQIELVTPEYKGDYVCEISGHPGLRVTHTLQVLVPPAIKLDPEDGHVIVKKGEAAQLRCMADGHPKPIVTWSSRTGVLPGGQSTKQGSELLIPSVDVYHAGVYDCTADNEVGEKATAHFRIKVLYAPEIAVNPEWAHGDEGATVEISCTCSAEPLPQIMWLRGNVKGQQLMENDRIQMVYRVLSSTKTKLTFKIRGLRKEDLGSYSCMANNSVGAAWKTVEISGLAEPVQIRRDLSNDWQDANSYLLLWTVKSHSPIIEYLLRIRKLKNGGEWTEVMIPVAESDYQSLLHSHSYNITGLSPASKYEVVLQARNHFGWNRPSETFHFTTGSLSIDEEINEQNKPSLLPLYEENTSTEIEKAQTDYTNGNNSFKKWSSILLLMSNICIIALI